MLKRLFRTAIPCRQYATRQRRRAPAPVVDVESQISEFPEEQRKQIMDQLHGELPRMDQKEVGGDDFTANLILEFLENAESPAALDDGFWKTVRGLARSATRQRNPEYLEIFAALFDSAKGIESPELRHEMLYEIGRYIYRQKRVRMDPVNEVEFLDTLVTHGRPFSALQLWRSRQAKPDVADSVYWPEVGVLYYIEAGLLRSADALAAEMTQDLDGYVPPRVLVALIEAFSRQIRRNRDVAFAKKRLEAWGAKLMSDSLVSRLYVDNDDEPRSIDEKLQERKEVTAVDRNRSLTAIIAARQWLLATAFADSFQEMSREDLMKALQASTESKHTVEDEVIPFLDTILSQDPERADDGRLLATVALSFVRSGEIDDMKELLKEMSLRPRRPTAIPEACQAAIAQVILAQRTISLDEKLSIINECLSGPSVAREVVRRLHKESRSQQIAAYWAQYDGKVSNGLALEIIRSKSVTDEADLLRLAVSQESWKYLWYLIAAKKVSVAPETAFRVMLQQCDRSELELNAAVMALVTPAMVVGKTNILEGAATALAALQVRQDKYNVPVTHADGAVLLETLKRTMKGRRLVFTPPSRKDYAAALLQGAQSEALPFEKLVVHVAGILRAEDLPSRVECAARALLD